MPVPDELRSAIQQALALLSPDGETSYERSSSHETLPSLLKQCKEECAVLDATTPEPLRTLHHFACTGGSLLARCIQAQPNTVLLSEIDPFSSLDRNSIAFAPLDILKQALVGLRSLSDEGIEATFLGGMTAMHEALCRQGQRLVLRDHTHSHFCTEAEPMGRPLIRTVLEKRFVLRSLVTVRHPLDSYLSLRRNDWVMFSPGTLDEYCRRYLLFLDSYDETPVLRYEDFVVDPAHHAERMGGLLQLPYNAHWQDMISVITVTGDSGRRSDEIGPRERRAVPDDLAEECAQGAQYIALCGQLGYDPDVTASAFETESRSW